MADGHSGHSSQQSTPRQRHKPRLLLVPVKDSEVWDTPCSSLLPLCDRLTCLKTLTVPLQACQEALRWVLHNLWRAGERLRWGKGLT